MSKPKHHPYAQVKGMLPAGVVGYWNKLTFQNNKVKGVNIKTNLCCVINDVIG
ncbi:MAG: hypothetical protein JJU02_02770 [Cryomorphaceae bacterium]|nr:hypothetical protein [Cryomorphaceae bacterium]